MNDLISLQTSRCIMNDKDHRMKFDVQLLQMSESVEDSRRNGCDVVVLEISTVHYGEHCT